VELDHKEVRDTKVHRVKQLQVLLAVKDRRDPKEYKEDRED